MSDETGVVLLSSNKKEREAYENYAGLHMHESVAVQVFAAVTMLY